MSNCQLSIVNYQLSIVRCKVSAFSWNNNIDTVFSQHPPSNFVLPPRAFPVSRSAGRPSRRHGRGWVSSGFSGTRLLLQHLFVNNQLRANCQVARSWSPLSSALMGLTLHVHCSLISQSCCKGTKEIPSHQIQPLVACKNLLTKNVEILNKCK